MLDQRRTRWADSVQMLCKDFVFVGILRGQSGAFHRKEKMWQATNHIPN